jgi:uncharacterized protein YxjI
MKLIFKQRIFSFFDSYDIYDDLGNTIFKVKGRFSFGKHFDIYDSSERLIGYLKSEIFTFRPKFKAYANDKFIGCITKELTFFRPKFTIDLNGWQVEGDFREWDYHIEDALGNYVATASKDLFKFTDTYIIEIPNSENALAVLMIVLAIDAEKDQRN